MKIGLLITGNEVLYAKIKDTNGPFMASILAQKGIAVVASLTCSDSRSELLESLNYLANKCDAILMTGGLGPTSDDLTAEVVASFFNVPQEFNSEAWDHCVSIFAQMGRSQVSNSNRKQALLPQGAVLMPNPNGTAVGFCTQGKMGADAKGGAKPVAIYAMPGVPHECEPMFVDHVLPRFIVSKFSPVARVWQVFAMGESTLQSAVDSFEQQLMAEFPNAVISYQAHFGYVTYTLSMVPLSESQQKHIEEFFSNIAEPFLNTTLAHHIAYRTAQPVAHYLVSAFSRAKKKLTFAESCTGGLLAKEICAVAGASQIFSGSFVTYSNRSKQDILNIPEQILQNQGAVSGDVVALMSKQALTLLQSDVAVAVSGIAGPDGGSPEKPVGMVYFGLSVSKQAVQNLKLLTSHLHHFGWSHVEPSDQSTEGEHDLSAKVYTFICVKKFGDRQQRYVIQNRSSTFALCSVALLVPFFSK